MAVGKDKLRSHCPINFSLEIFGDKWTLLIIRDLAFNGMRYYGEFMNAGEGFATNILADRLNVLEEADIIRKEIDKNKKSRYIYSLTEKGIDLVPMLIEMVHWGSLYDKDTASPPEFIKRLKNDKENVIKEFMNQLKKTHLK